MSLSKCGKDLDFLIASGSDLSSKPKKLQLQLRPPTLKFHEITLFSKFNTSLTETIVKRFDFHPDFLQIFTGRPYDSPKTRKFALSAIACIFASTQGHSETFTILMEKLSKVNFSPTDHSTIAFFNALIFCAIAYNQEFILNQILNLLLANVELKNAVFTGIRIADYSPLHYAAITGNHKMLKILLQSGCLVNSRNINSQHTALHLAITVGAEDVVEVLLNAKADPMIKSDGYNCIHHVCKRGYSHILLMILNSSAAKVDLDAFSDEGQSALHYASHAGHIECVKILCLWGADIDVRDGQGTTPLFRSLEGTAKRVDVAMCLIEQFGVDVHRADNEGWTAAHYAARWGYTKIMKRLLEKNVDYNATDIDGWSILHCACKGGNLEIVKMLVKQGADVHKADVEKWGCMHFAADSSEDPVQIIEFLLNVGVDPAEVSRTGLTALHLVCRWGFSKSCALILKAGAPPSIADNLGRTPLHMATKGGNVDCVRMLAPIADVNCKDSDNQTPLHYFSVSVVEEPILYQIVELLLQYSADPNILDTNNLSPLYTSVRKKFPTIANLLLLHGADIHVTDQDGNTPLHILACLNIPYTQEYISLVKKLGELVNVRNSKGHTALMVAVMTNLNSGGVNVEFVRIVVENLEVDFGVVDEDGRSLLHWCMASGASEVAVMVLERGADPSLKDKEGKVPGEVEPVAGGVGEGQNVDMGTVVDGDGGDVENELEFEVDGVDGVDEW
ncbi:Nuclear factor NF-kappa-B p105 subunit [Nowakowskiella sp. JEL0407]|nr:Nuclear factor NF-kappa-B p105 subunit [Nowakowskiella sp. JEL0407]